MGERYVDQEDFFVDDFMISAGEEAAMKLKIKETEDMLQLSAVELRDLFGEGNADAELSARISEHLAFKSRMLPDDGEAFSPSYEFGNLKRFEHSLSKFRDRTAGLFRKPEQLPHQDLVMAIYADQEHHAQ